MSKTNLSPPPPPSSAALQAARSFGLGALRQTIPVVKHPALRFRIIGYAHEFEYGFVWHLDEAEPVTYRWDQVATVNWSATRMYASGFYKGTEFSFTLKSSDERILKVSGFCQEPAVKRKADPQAASYRMYQFLTRARDAASAMLLPGAIAALSRGEQLLFGDFRIGSAGIQAPKGFVPWSSIKDVRVSNGLVSINKEGKFFPLSLKKVGQIPNFPLFLILAETLRRQATGNGSPGNAGT
jgi:hypothetical protein